MNKGVIALIVVIILFVIVGGIAYFVSQNSNEGQENLANQNRLEQNRLEQNNVEQNTTEQNSIEQNAVIGNNTATTEENNGDNTGTGNAQTLVVYFSAQGHTEEVAHKIASNLSADIFEIVPVDEYTSDDLDWTDDNSRTSREYEDESLRDVELVSTTVENWENYDTVLIGYPIWWGIAAWPVDTFVEANDFNGKTVIPFCTSSSSGLGQSGELLAEKANGGNWLEGHRFSSNPSDSDINNWTNNLED